MLRKNRKFHISYSLLVFLIASSFIAATDRHEEKCPRETRPKQLRDQVYYQDKLTELKASTYQIQTRINQIVEKFKRNLESYYRLTKGVKTPDSNKKVWGQSAESPWTPEPQKRQQEKRQCNVEEQERNAQESIRQSKIEADLRRKERNQDAQENFQKQQQQKAEQPIAEVMQFGFLTVNWIQDPSKATSMSKGCLYHKISVPFTAKDIVTYAEEKTQTYQYDYAAITCVKLDDVEYLIKEIVKWLDKGLLPEDDFVSLRANYFTSPMTKFSEHNKELIAKYVDGLLRKALEAQRQSATQNAGQNEAKEQSVSEMAAQKRRQAREEKALKLVCPNPKGKARDILQKRVYQFYYDQALGLFGLASIALDEAVKKSYEEFVCKLDPQKNPTQATMFQEIKKAYEYIMLCRNKLEFKAGSFLGIKAQAIVGCKPITLTEAHGLYNGW